MNKRDIISNVGNTTVRFPDNIKVFNNNAPTIDQAKYLDELRKQAKEDIIAVYRPDPNVLDGVVMVLRSMAFDMVTIIFKWKLNGNEYKTENNIEYRHFYNDKTTLMQEFFECVGKSITRELVRKNANVFTEQYLF